MSTVAYQRAVERDLDRMPVAAMPYSKHNFSVCENCGHDLTNQMPGHGAQLWSCADCGSVRQWGLANPTDRNARPALCCDQCQTVTWHEFLGVIGLA